AKSSPVNPIKTLHSAMTRLGVRSVMGLVTSMSAIRVFLPTTAGQKNIWLHSVQVATCARVISQKLNSRKVNPEHAYLCGLMHDIGRFALFDKVSDELNRVDEAGWDSPKKLVDTEHEIFGFNHADIGARVCKRWGLPQFIADVVSHHHVQNLKDISSRDPKDDDLVHIVQLADNLSMFMMIFPDALSWTSKELINKLDIKCVRPLGANSVLSAKELQPQMSNIIDESNKIISTLGLSPVN
ncbi:MAG: HDOD domain-containing protein, partial [Cycloclasticus sp.]|nr:HDOD domain-containing protein [Cycloclasticus sp.]